MKIELTSALEKIVVEKVEEGRYSSPEEVVGEALRQLQAREASEQGKLARLNAAIEKGRQDVEAGRVHRFETAEELADFVRDL